MARYQASMKMGALNLLILIIALSLTVLSVLILVTAQASQALSDKQMESIDETYAEEVAGQQFLAALDKKLAPSKGAKSLASGLNSALKLSVQDMADEACVSALDEYPEIELSATAELLSVKALYSEMKVAYTLRNNLDNEELFEELASGVASAGSTSNSADSAGSNGSNASNGSSASAEEEIIDDDAASSGEEVIIDDEPSVNSSSKKATTSDTSSAANSSTSDTEIYVSSPTDEPDTHEFDYYYSLAEVLQDCVGGITLDISAPGGRNLSAVIGIKADGQYVILSWKSAKIWYAAEKTETLWMG